jgi:hypothetical protein
MKCFSKSIIHPLLYTAFIVPLDPSSWKHIDFGKIKKNEITFENSINIKVDNSSSFLIHKLKAPIVIKSITIEVEISKLLQINSSADDYPFKLGLVIEGDKKLSGMKKFFAPKWVIEVYKFAKKNKGLDHIEMFIATFNKELYSARREHPKSDLFMENFIFQLTNKGSYKFTHKLDKPITTSALWLSADGDGSKSKFTTKIKSISFN